VDDININHKNSTFFPEYTLPDGITASSDLINVVTDAEMILSVVPAQFVRNVLKQWVPHARKDALIVSASKGIVASEGKVMLMCDIFREALPPHLWANTAFISGPSFAKELAAHKPTVIVVAAEDESVAQTVVQQMVRPFFRMYWTNDIVGVEIGGSIKNVIALACGICDGLDMGNNARAAVITRGLTEMARIGMALGADQGTFMGLAGMGDLVLTCSSEMSRNRTVGFALGQGKPLDEVLNMPQVAEGVYTAGPAYQLARQLGIETPILDEVYLFVTGKVTLQGAASRLLQRPYKAETVWCGEAHPPMM
jgi:glycerol-3-phosphate dehydrogenase (NAD(P)+)